MDGATSPPASGEEEPSGGAADLDPRRPAAPVEGQGYVDSLLRTSLQMLRKGRPPEIRRQGLKLMMHLLRYRWDELRIEERWASDDIADLVPGLYGTTYMLPSKNAISTLIAEAILSGGISLLIDLLPSIITLANKGPTEAELAAFIFKWISDFRIVCPVDLDGGQSEAILSGLDEALPNILLILSSLLEKYGGSVLAKHPEQLTVSSKKHGLTVAACLLAANAYAEWVPVVHLAKSGLIERCKSLLNFSNPHVLVLRFFKVVCQRRRPLYATEDYDATMSLIFWILMGISKDSLTTSKNHSSFLDESRLEFAGWICECLVAMGSFNMQFIIKDGNRATHFFRQMLEYYQHHKIALHFRCLQFWLMVLMDLSKERYAAPYPVVASAVNSASLMNSDKKGNCAALVFVSDDICDGMLDTSFRRMLKKSAVTSPVCLELWSDELHGKNGFIQYRSLLLDLIRFIAYERPIIAASRAVKRISCIIEDASAITKDPKDFAAIESAQLGLETVVRAIFGDEATIVLETKHPLQRICKIFEGLLVQLLSLNWTEPELVVILGRYFDALCPFLRHFTDAVAMVVTKLLELISSTIVDCHDPSKAQCARLQICSCIIHISQAVDITSFPSDMKDLFSVPHITEEDVLAFVESNITAYSVEQKHTSREGNKDGGATHPSSGSYVMPSIPNTYMTSGLRPWAQNVQSLGLSTALSYFHDLPGPQPSFSSCSAPSFAQSNDIACTMNHKKLDHNLIICPQLYHTSFPAHGSVPISWLRLGTKFQNGNEAKCLNLTPESQMSTGVTDGSTEFVGERNLGIVGTMSCHQDKGQLLLVEHNILSEAFADLTSFPRVQDMEHLLTDILNIVNKIWTLSDWEDKYMRHTYCLSGLFANDQFRRAVCSLVKSFEKLLGNRILESEGTWEGPSASADYVHSSTLPKLMLPLILRVLNCIQMLWREPISYDLSGLTANDIKFILENGKLPDSDEAEMLQSAETWSQDIRETGYNVIGLCASVKGAFYGLLDKSSIINVLAENSRSMEFKHLGKLIRLVLIPLVKYCPRDCWDEWMVRLLEPVFSYCEEILYYAWFTFLHEGRAKVPAYLGNPSGPEEIVNQYEKEILLKFTRSISDLLGVLASERLNSGLSLLSNQLKTSTMAGVQDLKSISSNSIVGYLLLHNCFGRLSMYLFGCLADYQAAENALPFCYSLIHLARATNHERLNQFILNEMLPTIILLLGVDVKSAISQLNCSINSTTKEDAMNNVTRLCMEIYEAYVDNQVTAGEEVSDRFKHWLANELEDLHKRASNAVPDDFPKDVVWNWELNEEFERYLPTYMNLLEEVDAMDDCLEDDYLDQEILFEKLRPDFKSRYSIDSYMHPYLHTMSCMLQRKMPAVYYQKCTKLISECLERLVTLKPYVKCTDSWDSILKRLLPTCEPQHDIWQCNPANAVDIFRGSLLFYWEPQFHPLIREGHKELLKTIARQLALTHKSVLFEPLVPHPDDFSEHLQPYACMYIKRKKKEFEYFTIEEQVRLHEEFDKHLASGILDHRMNEFSSCKDDFEFPVGDLADSSFGTLNRDLIAMSLERRAKIVEWEAQMSSYAECLKSVLENDEMKDELLNLMKMMKEAGFFNVDDDRVDWDNKLFSDSIVQFKEMVFPGKCIDKCLVIRGIMDYQKISQMKDVDWQGAFKMVVSNTNDLWKENLRQFWVTTRHYTHYYYDTLAQPLQKVFLNGGAPKPRYG
ncbi:unnamed protein product [Urochloa humidicola]